MHALNYWAVSSPVRRIPCDTILVSGGWAPAIHAGLQQGGIAQYQGPIDAFVAAEQPAGRTAAGSARGLLELAAVLHDGHAAGERAARSAGATGDCGAAPDGLGDAAPAIAAFARTPASRGGEKRQFVDLQNDVTVADLRTALAEGFSDIEHLKRYTTLGVGTDQGRVGGLLGAAIAGRTQGGNARPGRRQPQPGPLPPGHDALDRRPARGCGG